MGGLSKVLQIYGSMTVQGNDGKKVEWVWDYASGRGRLKSEISKEEIDLSEKAKRENAKIFNSNKDETTNP